MSESSLAMYGNDVTNFLISLGVLGHISSGGRIEPSTHGNVLEMGLH
jgi:hypothetical protein